MSHHLPLGHSERPRRERASERPPPLRAGELFEGLRVLGQLGRSESSWLFRIRDERSHTEYALKLIPNQHGYKRRARDEAIVLHRLQHPNVVQILSAGLTPDDAHIFIVMEVLEGFSLRQVLTQLERLSVPEVITLGAQICDAVSAAHQLGVVHRDLRPENIVVCPGNLVKVTDFGIAKFLLPKGDDGAGLRWHRTPLYASPEQLRGARVTPQSDVYAIGSMLYEALLGTHPCRIVEENGHYFEQDASDQELALLQLEKDATPLHDLVEGLDRELGDTIGLSLSKQPQYRWDSGLALGNALREQLERVQREARKRGIKPALRDLVTATHQAMLPRAATPWAAVAAGTLQERTVVTADAMREADRIASERTHPRAPLNLVAPSPHVTPELGPARSGNTLRHGPGFEAVSVPHGAERRRDKTTVPNSPEALRRRPASAGAHAKDKTTVPDGPEAMRRAGLRPLPQLAMERGSGQLVAVSFELPFAPPERAYTEPLGLTPMAPIDPAERPTLPDLDAHEPRRLADGAPPQSGIRSRARGRFLGAGVAVGAVLVVLVGVRPDPSARAEARSAAAPEVPAAVEPREPGPGPGVQAAQSPPIDVKENPKMAQPVDGSARGRPEEPAAIAPEPSPLPSEAEGSAIERPTASQPPDTRGMGATQPASELPAPPARRSGTPKPKPIFDNGILY